jgi:hypothetical protein
MPNPTPPLSAASAHLKTGLWTWSYQSHGDFRINFAPYVKFVGSRTKIHGNGSSRLNIVGKATVEHWVERFLPKLTTNLSRKMSFTSMASNGDSF